jgi:hypothetical protein
LIDTGTKSLRSKSVIKLPEYKQAFALWHEVQDCTILIREI